jgi:hypothetical protein
VEDLNRERSDFESKNLLTSNISSYINLNLFWDAKILRTKKL